MDVKNRKCLLSCTAGNSKLERHGFILYLGLLGTVTFLIFISTTNPLPYPRMGFSLLFHPFSKAASENRAGTKRQQDSPVSPDQQSRAPCPCLKVYCMGTVSGVGMRVKEEPRSLLASPLTTEFFTISIIPGREPDCRETDSLFREEERWGLVRA